jgi:excisionase family DNA binding protein
MANGHLGGASKHYLTLKEAAAYLRVDRKTFHRWTKGPRKDRPPIIKISRNCIRIPIEEFTNWIKSKQEN